MVTKNNAKDAALTYALGYLAAVEGFAQTQEERDSASRVAQEIRDYLEAAEKCAAAARRSEAASETLSADTFGRWAYL